MVRVCECACPVGKNATSNAAAHAQRVAYVENMRDEPDEERIQGVVAPGDCVQVRDLGGGGSTPGGRPLRWVSCETIASWIGMVTDAVVTGLPIETGKQPWHSRSTTKPSSTCGV